MFLNDVMKLQHELEQFFNHDMSLSSSFSRGLYPALNIFEKGDTLTIKAEMPGISKENLKLEIQKDMLLLSGEVQERSEPQGYYHRREREFGSFARKVKLPYRVNSEKVKANLEDGLLTITLEKEESEKAKLITVQ